MYCEVNNLCGWTFLQKILVDGFKCRNDKANFDEKSIKNYHENSDKGNIFEVICRV